MKNLVGTQIFVQSAGVKSEYDIDGFAVTVCKELDVELSKHKVRSFEDLEDWGDRLDSFDLVVALSPTSHNRIMELTKGHAWTLNIGKPLIRQAKVKAAKINWHHIAPCAMI